MCPNQVQTVVRGGSWVTYAVPIKSPSLWTFIYTNNAIQSFVPLYILYWICTSLQMALIPTRFGAAQKKWFSCQESRPKQLSYMLIIGLSYIERQQRWPLIDFVVSGPSNEGDHLYIFVRSIRPGNSYHCIPLLGFFTGFLCAKTRFDMTKFGLFIQNFVSNN